MSRPVLESRPPLARIPTAGGDVSQSVSSEHIEQLQADFVSLVTHQLRTPLSGIRWMLELARDAESPENARSFVIDAHASTTRLITLVNELLDVARLEAEQSTSQPTSLARRAVAGDVDSPGGDYRNDDMNSATIVLAEDDPFLRRAGDVALSKRGFTVVLAADGVEALEAVRAHRPALLLLDLQMPRMGGMEVLTAIRDDDSPVIRRTRVVILSNSPKELAIHDAQALGVCDYWVKAELSIQELGSRVAALITAVPA